MEFVEAVFFTAISASEMAVMTTDAELLFVVGSVTAEVTLAELVFNPSANSLTVIATDAVALLVMLPKLHVTMPFDCVALPWLGEAET